MTEEDAYASALHELQTGTMNPGIFAKAMAYCDGDESKAKANYLRFRAEQLLKEDRSLLVSQRAHLVSTALFSAKGSISRQTYFVTLLLIGAAAILLSGIVSAYDPYGIKSGQELQSLIIIGCFVILIIASIKRCRDVGISPWWCVILVVLWPLAVVLACVPSRKAMPLGDGAAAAAKDKGIARKE
jgi:uncharacterized membrane protein YhaH (DUF805 family)